LRSAALAAVRPLHVRPIARRLQLLDRQLPPNRGQHDVRRPALDDRAPDRDHGDLGDPWDPAGCDPGLAALPYSPALPSAAAPGAPRHSVLSARHGLDVLSPLPSPG